MKITGAPRTVLVLLLAIAALELGISSKFSILWQLAFTGHIKGAEEQGTPVGEKKPAASASSSAPGRAAT